jgi:hypothetical protein
LKANEKYKKNNREGSRHFHQQNHYSHPNIYSQTHCQTSWDLT